MIKVVTLEHEEDLEQCLDVLEVRYCLLGSAKI